jgi:hypothetical protein
MGEGVAVPLKVPNVGEAFVGPSWMDNRSYPASKLKAAKFKVITWPAGAQYVHVKFSLLAYGEPMPPES